MVIIMTACPFVKYKFRPDLHKADPVSEFNPVARRFTYGCAYMSLAFS